MKVKVGVVLAFVPPADLLEAGAVAEQLGFESAWIGEHIIIPEESDSDSPYAGHPLMLPTMRFYEPLVAAAAIGARTTTLRVGTGILIMPLRDPFLTARAIVTADHLSGGRLMVGLGAGWMREEFSIMNLSFRERGRRFDEQLELLERLLLDDAPEHHGSIWDLPKSGFEPKSLQQPRAPIMLAGITLPALRRCAARADAWYGSRHTPAEVAEAGRILAELRGAPMPLTAGRVEGATLAEYAEAGAERLIVTPRQRSSEWRAGLEELAEEFDLDPIGHPAPSSGRENGAP